MKQGLQDVADERQPAVHARREGLHGKVLVELVDDEPRQEVGLSVDETERLCAREEPSAQFEGIRDALLKKAEGDLLPLEAEQPERDQ